MSDLFSEQQRRNRLSYDAWQAFAAHRSRVMELLVDAAKNREQPALMLLGAGNCNDVDLRQLLVVYSRIHLIDLDAAALQDGLRRQGVEGEPAIVLDGEVDLLNQPGIESDQPSTDVVASLCLLSQLIEAATTQFAGSSEDQLAVVQVVRRQHLELILNSVRPGGVGLLITDFVSSDTAPELTNLDDAHLPALAARCLATRNFFTGLNPAVIVDLLKHDPHFAAHVEEVAVTPPWKWDLGPRSYLVYATRFRRLA